MNLKRNKGICFILSSPSGAGKTSLSRRLISEDDNLNLSISVTTRAPRAGEVNGVHYYFVSQEKFQSLIKESQFIEYAKVFDNYYGTLEVNVKEALNKGIDVLFDIDWQGARTLKSKLGDDTVSIFILPPSMSELRNRLVMRGQDNMEVIENRMLRAAGEISHASEYDYCLVNKDFEKTLARLRAILEAERMKTKRISNLQGFLT